jgi:transposase InsO family protein
MNTDQGSQFSSSAFIGLLQEHRIQVSMDGKGCWRNNVFVARIQPLTGKPWIRLTLPRRCSPQRLNR